MKVIAINGSPHAEGNTALAIRTVFAVLEEAGIETEILQIGGANIVGCRGCGACLKIGRCVFADEQFDHWVEEINRADGVLLASPVYYGNVTGGMKAFLDRFFYQNRRHGNMRLKVGASLAVTRRSGAVPTVITLDRYLQGAEMILVPNASPNIAFGNKPGEVLLDEEGQDSLRRLGRNMTWLLKTLETAREQVPQPPRERRKFMNFIRPD